ncbi:MAG: PilW family protein [Halofilum sp. (in: g-proteobacteria)]|nr:PilW family protein [Halofilum sp. (in: g-proteobacteria)]
MAHANRNILSRQHGLTLIEIMIALLLSLLLLLGVAQIFSGNRRTQRFQSALTRIQENGRFAIDELTFNLRQTGFRGCGGNNKTIINKLTGPGASDFDLGTEDELQGHRFSGGNWVPDDPEIATVNDQATVRANDVLTFKTLDPNISATVASPHNTGNANIEFTENVDFLQCDIVIVSTCSRMVVFVNTDNSGNKRVTHSVGNNCTGSPPDVANDTNTISQDMSGGSLLRFKSYTYYVDQAPDRNVPSLYREDEAGNTVELVPGVQRMSLDYGEDTNGDGQADGYEGDPAVVGSWTDVVAVRLELLLVSEKDRVTDDSQTYTFNGNQVTAGDNRLYQVFTTTVALRNRTQ